MPAAVVVTGLGILVLSMPLSKGVAYIVPPDAAPVLVLARTIGIVVGGAGGGWARSREVGGAAAGTGTDRNAAAPGASHPIADAPALAGLALALVALMAIGTVFVLEPILASLQGPDPCRPPTFQPDTACFSAHPDYYRYDPVEGSWSTPGSRLSRTLDPIAGPAAVPLALGAALFSWLALAMCTPHRPTSL